MDDNVVAGRCTPAFSRPFRWVDQALTHKGRPISAGGRCRVHELHWPKYVSDNDPGPAAIFAIVSPLQYLNALEAIHAFELRADQCFLAIGECERMPESQRQVRQILDPSLWACIEQLSGFPSTPLGHEVRTDLRSVLGARKYANRANSLIRRARSDCGSVGQLFIGDYRPTSFRHFIAKLREAETWLLDDGTLTHHVVRYRGARETGDNWSEHFPSSSKRRRFRSLLSGLRFAEPKRVGFFTSYELEAPPQDRLRTHHYELRKRSLEGLVVRDEVWFLGTNHVEAGVTTSDKYDALLARVKSQYEGRTLAYLPHRGESPEKLERLERLGFEVRRHGLPIEVAIAELGHHPQVFAGLASSALDNLALLLAPKIRIDLFEAPSDYAPEPKWQHLKEIMNYHRADRFGVTRVVSAE